MMYISSLGYGRCVSCLIYVVLLVWNMGCNRRELSSTAVETFPKPHNGSFTLSPKREVVNALLPPRRIPFFVFLYCGYERFRVALGGE